MVAGESRIRPVVLHSSWRGRAKAATAPTILLAVSVVGFAAGGVRPVPVVMLLAAVVLAAVVIVDYPVHVVFGPDGIERRCLVRRELLHWDRITAVVRPAYRNQIERWAKPSTGLVAVMGRRRYLLTDKMESRAEFEVLLRGMGDWARGVRAEATQPPADTPPTWLYKRRRGTAHGALVDQL